MPKAAEICTVAFGSSTASTCSADRSRDTQANNHLAPNTSLAAFGSVLTLAARDHPLHARARQQQQRLTTAAEWGEEKKSGVGCRCEQQPQQHKASTPVVHVHALHTLLDAAAAAGALSGAISRFLVGPLDVVKIRFQVQLEPISLHTAMTKRPPHYHGFLHAFRTIVAEEGIKVRMPSAGGCFAAEVPWPACLRIWSAWLSQAAGVAGSALVYCVMHVTATTEHQTLASEADQHWLLRA
jgi:hypothetical protein